MNPERRAMPWNASRVPIRAHPKRPFGRIITTSRRFRHGRPREPRPSLSRDPRVDARRTRRSRRARYRTLVITSQRQTPRAARPAAAAPRGRESPGVHRVAGRTAGENRARPPLSREVRVDSGQELDQLGAGDAGLSSCSVGRSSYGRATTHGGAVDVLECVCEQRRCTGPRSCERPCECLGTSAA